MAVCSGGIVHVTITLRNDGPDDVDLDPQLVITDVYPHVGLARLSSVAVPAGEHTSISTDVSIPQLPAGPHRIFLTNTHDDNGVTIIVKAPLPP